MEWVESLMKAGSRETLTAALPQGSFYCLLDELPLHLIPQRGQRALRLEGDASGLFVNPDCELRPAADLPPEFSARPDLVSGFALQGTIAWLRDPTTQNLQPFWLGPEFEAIVRNLHAGQVSGSTLNPNVRAILLAAGILRHAGQDELRTSAWQASLRNVAAAFQQKGYAPIAGLIHPFHVAALRRHYRQLIRTSAIRLGDRQSSRRYAAHNDPVARFFHHEIARIFSAIAGEPLRPSYVYLASYLSGAELKKHTDREQCDFSLTFCLDFSPEPELATPWPIRLDPPSGTVTIYQALGDALAYRGARLPHYRDALGEGQTSTSIFFHYVGADFKGSLD